MRARFPRQLLRCVLAVWAIGVLGYGCTLNPHPLPPETGFNGGVGQSNGSSVGFSGSTSGAQTTTSSTGVILYTSSGNEDGASNAAPADGGAADGQAADAQMDSPGESASDGSEREPSDAASDVALE